VFDLIEHGDRTGWMQASRRQNYQLTLDLLDEAQQLMDVDAVVDLAYLTDMRAWCHLNLAQHELALRAETDAIALAEENRLPEVSRYILNSVLIHREMGHADLAVSILKDFLARTDHAADNEQIVEKGRQLMDMLRTEGVHGLRRFLTRYRPGHVPWARRAHQ